MAAQNIYAPMYGLPDSFSSLDSSIEREAWYRRALEQITATADRNFAALVAMRRQRDKWQIIAAAEAGLGLLALLGWWAS